MPAELTSIPLEGIQKTELPLGDSTGQQSRIILDNAELLLTEILDSAFEAIISITSDHLIMVFNRGAERTFGYTAEEMINQPLELLIPEKVRNHHRSHMANFGRSDETGKLMNRRGEIKGLRKDGSEFPAEATISKQQIGKDTIFTVVLRDITERKKGEEELKLALLKSEEANRVKSDFLTNISHELRTPLNAIIGFSEIMGLETFGPVGATQYKNYVREIHDGGAHLLSLVNDILDLAKIEAGRTELHEEAVDLKALVDDCCRTLEGQAKKADIVLGVQICGDLQPLKSDKRAIRQIITNLLSNAVKFTPNGGSVLVHARIDEGGCLVLGVTDTGIGIAADDIPMAFTVFGQIDSSLTREQTGTGLGLPLVKSLADLHGASFELESELGVGTTARVSFPAERVLYGSGELAAGD